jgi:predicted RNA binding protein YcfA (HicA-like mRNA interferase family)
MTRKTEKIFAKMKRTLTGWNYEDCEKVLLSLGYKVRQTRGSHYIFSKDQCYITIAKHKPVSKDAVKDVIEAWNKEYKE